MKGQGRFIYFDDSEGNTPLHCSLVNAWRNDPTFKSIQELIKAGANVNAQNK